MRYTVVSLLTAIFFLSQQTAKAETLESSSEPTQQVHVTSSFSPFTGKITRNKVRMRLQPNLEGKIIRELGHDDLVLVIGEADDYYAIKPPQEVKAYIFRTFVLDNVIEGKHVNVRLNPDLESPIIGQLNSGDSVDGTISPLNSKWLEITPPDTVKFYISKEYVEKIGDANALAQIIQRRETVNQLLETAYQTSETEIQKPFTSINIDKVVDNFNKIIHDYSDFPDQAARANELLSNVQELYMQKKLAYLEAKTKGGYDQPANEEHLSDSSAEASDPVDDKMAAWIPIETALYAEWTKENSGASMTEYYAKQKEDAIVLTGIIEPYIRNMRNKPGDYLLVSSNSRLPSAYLYSTKINLSQREGKEVKIVAVPRPNHNFAHPAYFVLSVE